MCYKIKERRFCVLRGCIMRILIFIWNYNSIDFIRIEMMSLRFFDNFVCILEFFSFIFFFVC